MADIKKIEVDGEIHTIYGVTEEQLATKQDKLTAGDNITITDNVISAEGGGIEVVDTLPETTEEELNKHKLYFYNDNLIFLAKKANTTPSLQVVNISISVQYYSCASVGDYIYIFGGKSGSSVTNSIYKLNITTKEVQQLTTTLPATRSYPTVAAVGTNIYIFGGDNDGSTTYNTIYKFDTTNETISTLSATLNGARMGMGVVVYGNIIYLFGGYTSSATNTIYKFDTTTESMYKVATTLPSVAYNIPLTLTNGLIYLFGGRDNTTTSVYVFNPADETITEETGTTLPVTQWNSSAVLSKGDDIFLFGGIPGSSTNTNKIYHYNTQTKQFILLSQMLDYSFGSRATWTVVGTNIYMLSEKTLQIGSLSEYVAYKTIKAE